MVKIHCDRCGADIKEEYYTINIRKESTNPVYTITDCANAISTAAYNMREDALRLLNSKVMYCEKCKNEIEKFINRT